MIFIVVGNKIERQKYIHDICAEHQIEKSYIQHIYDNDLKNAPFHHLVSIDTSLFGDSECYVLHDLLRDLDIKNIFEEYKDSPHIIVFSEDSILKKITTEAEKKDIQVIEFEKEKKQEKTSFNIFSLADALGNRDKKQLWLLFREAIQNASPEEIHGILFWQLKNMTLVKTSNSNPGLNNFVYSKNKKFVGNFSKSDLLRLNAEFIRMFHERDSYSTLDIELEKMILSL